MRFITSCSGLQRAGAKRVWEDQLISAAKSDIVVLGAGIAGLSAARFLREAGHEVLVVADALGEASRVPIALLNPVRGQRGTVVPETEEAFEAARELYSRFVRLRFGLLRPVPKAQYSKWEEKLRSRGIRYEWKETGLFLPDALWVETKPLLCGLAAGLEFVDAKVCQISNRTLHLGGGGTIVFETLVYAAGARGTQLLNLTGRFTAGSVLLTDEWFDEAVSHKGYVAGDVMGSTHLPEWRTYQEHQTTRSEAEEILAGTEKLVGRRPKVIGTWNGVRYRADAGYLKELPGQGYALTGFGSSAFLHAPLYAKKLVSRLRKGSAQF